MSNPEKDVRPDAKLKNLSDEELQHLWDLRYKPNGKLNKKLVAIQADVPLRYGFTISLSQLSLFFVWLKGKREWEQSKAIADQAKNEFLAAYPDASSDELLRVGQMHFTAVALQKGDNKGFVSLLKAITAREKAITDREKANAARQTKVEAGLDELLESIKGNPAAVAALENLKKVMGK